MRGDDQQTGWMFSYVSPEERVPADHPLRAIRQMTDAVFARLSPRFDRLYSDIGRPSIPPEKLLRALLLQGLYTVRSERLLMEQLQYNLLFRWFVGLGMDDRVWDPTSVHEESRPPARRRHRGRPSFRRSWPSRAARDCSPTIISRSTARCWRRGRVRRVSGGATRRVIRPKTPAIRASTSAAETRTNDTHQSTTDPDARLFTKSRGSAATLCYMGHLLTENRHGLIVNAWSPRRPGRRNGRRRWRCSASCRTPGASPSAATRTSIRETLSGDTRELGVTPHVAQFPRPTRRGQRHRGRTTRHPGYDISQRKRKLVEQAFGWMKTIGPMRKLHHRGGPLVSWNFTFAAAAYNLVRLRRLLPKPV